MEIQNICKTEGRGVQVTLLFRVISRLSTLVEVHHIRRNDTSPIRCIYEVLPVCDIVYTRNVHKARTCWDKISCDISFMQI